MRRPPFLIVTLLVGVSFLAACGAKTAAPATTKPACKTVARPAGQSRTRKPPSGPLAPGKTYDVVVDTSCGSFTIRLVPKISPHLAASFVSLARSGYYDGTIFHRIVPGFVIQGGDPTGTGTSGPGYSTVDVPPGNTRYVEGLVAMAKTQLEPRGTAGSQFFVVTGKDVGLPPDYAVLGRVVSGIDVVRLIGLQGDANQQPTRVITVDRMRVVAH